jgi:uncharacterized protein (TIGR00369 family)
MALKNKSVRQLSNPFSSLDGYNCFGCSPDNPNGLRMQFFDEGDTVVSAWEPTDDFQGWHNVLHGGIQATLMDEIASWVVFAKLGTTGVTSKMEVKLSRPMHMDKGPVKLVAKLREMRRNIAVIDVELLDGEGTKCAEGIFHYFTYPEKLAKERLFYPGREKF